MRIWRAGAANRFLDAMGGMGNRKRQFANVFKRSWTLAPTTSASYRFIGRVSLFRTAMRRRSSPHNCDEGGRGNGGRVQGARGPHLTDPRSAMGISNDLSRPIGSSVACRKDCLRAACDVTPGAEIENLQTESRQPDSADFRASLAHEAVLLPFRIPANYGMRSDAIGYTGLCG